MTDLGQRLRRLRRAEDRTLKDVAQKTGYDHAGEEFGLVLSGTLELRVEDQVYPVRQGDSFYFTSTRLHGFRNPRCRRKAVVLWVITPPSF